MNLMMPEAGLLFWMTVIFAIVFFILAKFGFPVITGMVDKRTKKIEDALTAAREAEERLANLQAEQEKIITDAKIQQDRILKETAREREAIIARAQDEARVEAEKILTDAKEKIELEKQNAIRQLRSEVASLSLAIAEKVLGNELSSKSSQREYADSLLDNMKKLDS